MLIFRNHNIRNKEKRKEKEKRTNLKKAPLQEVPNNNRTALIIYIEILFWKIGKGLANRLDHFPFDWTIYILT